MSVASEITRIANAKNDIATAIANKGVTVPNGTKIDGMATLIDSISTSQPEPEPAVDDDVIFIDYDGKIVYSYTSAQFANLTELPANPSHSGLTAQGWNWTLSDAKTYVASYEKLVIGQTYITSDEKTHIIIYLEQNYHNPYIGLAVNGTVTIEWGDGVSQDSTVTGTSTTTMIYTQAPYTKGGYYTIKIASVSGSYAIRGSSNAGSFLCTANEAASDLNYKYLYAVKGIHLGKNCTTPTYSFYNLGCLEYITIPTSSTTYGNYSFGNNVKVKAIIIPTGTTKMNTYAFNYCYASFISLPKSFNTYSNYLFRYAYQLYRFSIPPSGSSLESSVFQGLRILSEITIPSNITSIGTDMFSNCGSLKKLRFTSTTPPTAIATSFTTLTTDCVIYVPRAQLNTYTSASYYPDPNTYTYVGE